MIDRGKTTVLVGETLRDIGLLFVVFAPLEAVFQEGPSSTIVYRWDRDVPVAFDHRRDHH